MVLLEDIPNSVPPCGLEEIENHPTETQTLRQSSNLAHLPGLGHPLRRKDVAGEFCRALTASCSHLLSR
jgi:hypothetical protein